MPGEIEPAPALMDIGQTARYLSLSPHTLYAWVCKRQHELPFVKIGTRVLFRPKDLDAWIESHIQNNSNKV